MQKELGKYKILKEIATGGMAEIHIAKSTAQEGNERLFVIKMIRSGIKKNREVVHLFLNEARIATQLVHPNIVQMVDFGYCDGNYFMAMEYIHGKNLYTITSICGVSNQPLGIRNTLEIMTQCGQGLHYAHTKKDVMGRPLNIVHCDMSPHNIMVSFNGVVKIVDFGIAKAASRFERADDMIKGKLDYMPPEQLMGKPLDGRSDIFALGVVFWELVTGRRLFAHPNPEKAYQTLTRKKMPSVRKHNRLISKNLDRLILRALDKDPDNRFQTAQEMVEAIQTHMKQEGLVPQRENLALFMRSVFVEHMDNLKQIEEAEQTGGLEPGMFDDKKFEFDQGLHVSKKPRASREEAPANPTVVRMPWARALKPRSREQGDDRGSATAFWRAAWPKLYGVGSVVLVGLLLLWGFRNWPELRQSALDSAAFIKAANQPPPVKKTPPLAMVRITSAPPDAQVWFDGKEQCVTPCILDKQPLGIAHRVEVSTDGFEPFHEAFSLTTEGELRSIHALLKPIPGKAWGNLKVVSRPPGASVFLDGTRIDGLTPLVIPSILAGKHKLRVWLRGRQEWRADVEILPGQTLAMESGLDVREDIVKAPPEEPGGMMEEREEPRPPARAAKPRAR